MCIEGEFQPPIDRVGILPTRNYFSFPKNSTYNPGKTSKVSMVEDMIPPVTTTESGYCISEPTPVA